MTSPWEVGPFHPEGSDRDEIAQWAILGSGQIAGEEKTKNAAPQHLTYFKPFVFARELSTLLV